MSVRIKYPRTYHLPWSEGATSDDRTLKDCSHFVGREVVVTEKMDGENTTIYSDGVHARSIDSSHHWSRSRVKQLQGEIAYTIPDGWRFCGENMFAKHSIKYDELEDYFLLFSIWDENNRAKSWHDTVLYAGVIGLAIVPVLYQGVWDEDLIRNLYNDSMKDKVEGYVVRIADEFDYEDFDKSVAKFVRANHVQTDEHWMHQQGEENNLIYGYR